MIKGVASESPTSSLPLSKSLLEISLSPYSLPLVLLLRDVSLLYYFSILHNFCWYQKFLQDLLQSLQTPLDYLFQSSGFGLWNFCFCQIQQSCPYTRHLFWMLHPKSEQPLYYCYPKMVPHVINFVANKVTLFAFALSLSPSLTLTYKARLNTFKCARETSQPFHSSSINFEL